MNELLSIGAIPEFIFINVDGFEKYTVVNTANVFEIKRKKNKCGYASC